VEIQIFGTKKCAETRRALRFFQERRIRVHFVDLKEKAASPGELRRFVQKFGVEALVDREGKRFREKGLASAQRGEAWWIAALSEDPALLRTPLVRWKERLTVGVDEESWKGWVLLG
jgi:arsenate reductase-like glutaredoxin family protein